MSCSYGIWRLSHPVFFSMGSSVAPSPIAPPGFARGTVGNLRHPAGDDHGRHRPSPSKIWRIPHDARPAPGSTVSKLHGAWLSESAIPLRDGTIRARRGWRRIEGQYALLRELSTPSSLRQAPIATGLQNLAAQQCPRQPGVNGSIWRIVTRVVQYIGPRGLAFLHWREIWKDDTAPGRRDHGR